MSTGTLDQQQAAAWGQPAGQDDWTSGIPQTEGGAVDPLAGMDFDTEGVQPGAGRVEAAGAYHMEIAEAELKEQPNAFGQPYINMRLVVLQSAPNQSPAGSIMWHEMPFPIASDKEKMIQAGGGREVSAWILTMSSLCNFCEAAGIFRKEKGPDGNERFIDLATGTTKIDSSTLASRLKGRQVIARPEKDEWGGGDTGKPYGYSWRCKNGKGISRIDDSRNANVLMHEAALAAGGYKRFQAPQAPVPAQGQTAPQQRQAAPAQAPANGQHHPQQGHQAQHPQVRQQPQQTPATASAAAQAPAHAADQFDDL